MKIDARHAVHHYGEGVGTVSRRTVCLDQWGEGIEAGGRRRGACQANVLEQRVETGGVLGECGDHRLIG